VAPLIVDCGRYGIRGVKANTYLNSVQPEDCRYDNIFAQKCVLLKPANFHLHFFTEETDSFEKGFDVKFTS
jgi:hypothetical protein